MTTMSVVHLHDLIGWDVSLNKRYTFKKAFHVSCLMLEEVEVDNTVRCDENDDVTCWTVNSEKVINVEDVSSIKKLTPRHSPYSRTQPVASLFESNKNGWHSKVIVNLTLPRTNDT